MNCHTTESVLYPLCSVTQIHHQDLEQDRE